MKYYQNPCQADKTSQSIEFNDFFNFSFIRLFFLIVFFLHFMHMDYTKMLIVTYRKRL